VALKPYELNDLIKMKNFIDSNPEKVWKYFKRLTFLILIIGMVYLSTIIPMLRIKDSSSLSPGILSTRLPTEFIEGKTDVITIEAHHLDKYTLNNELEGNIEIDTIPLGSQMQIEIIDLSPSESQNFEVFVIGDKTQIIGSNLTPVWEFGITPLKPGEMSIGIKPTIGIINVSSNELETFGLRMIKKDINAEASFGYQIKKFVGSYWQWLMSILIMPIWLYSRSKILKALKKKKTSNEIGFKQKTRHNKV
jgi:hypothetical protein